MRGFAVAVALVLTLAGCGLTGWIPTEPHLGNVANLVEFHDQGVEWEVFTERISEGEAAEFTDESAAMLSTFQAVEAVSVQLAETFLPVVDRVERYADEQTHLLEADRDERRLYAKLYRRMIYGPDDAPAD